MCIIIYKAYFGDIIMEQLEILPYEEFSLDEREPRKWEPKKLNERHHQIKRLAFLGYSYKEIAILVGVTEVSVNQVMRSDLMQEALRMMHVRDDADTKSVMNKIADESSRNLQLLLDIRDNRVNGSTAKLRKEVASDLLAIAGISPIKKHQEVEPLLTSEDIKLMRARLEGEVIEAEVVE